MNILAAGKEAMPAESEESHGARREHKQRRKRIAWRTGRA